MKQRRISAIILAMILLLSSFCFTGTFAEELPKHELNLPGESAALPEVGGAEGPSIDQDTQLQPELPENEGGTPEQPEAELPQPENGKLPETGGESLLPQPEAGVSTPEPSPEQDAAVDMPAGGETSLETAAPEADKPELYLLLFDCGYALYGEKVFDASVVEKPGDPEGYILQFVRENIDRLLNADAQLRVRGYHSELCGDSKQVRADDEEAVDGLFDALLNIKAVSRKSSKLDDVLDEYADQIAAKCAEYDVKLLIFTGGVLNSKGSPDAEKLLATLQELREAGVEIQAFGLDVARAGLISEEDADCRLEQYFAEGEYYAAEIPVIDGVPDYDEARLNMMSNILVARMGNEQTRVERFDDSDEVLVLPGDTVLLLSKSMEGELIMQSHTAEKFSSLKDRLFESPLMISGWVISDAEAAAEQARMLEEQREVEAERAQDEQEQALEAILTEIRKTLESRDLDAKDRAPSSFMLPDRFDAERYVFSTGNTDVIDVQVKENMLTVTPLKAGETFVRCTDTIKGTPIDAVVRVIDTTLNLVTGEDNSLSAEWREGVLSWEIRVAEGAQAGMTASGSSAEFKPCTLEGVSWVLSSDGRSVSVSAEAVGSYEVSFRLSDAEGKQLNSQSGSLRVSHPLDPVQGPISLIAPYFKQQEGQLVALTSAGEKISLAQYNVAINPSDVLAIYYGGDGSSLYLAPERAGKAVISISEKYVNSDPVTFEVDIAPLSSNAMIWLCGVGAVLALIALTTGVVILIGKRAGRRGED